MRMIEFLRECINEQYQKRDLEGVRYWRDVFSAMTLDMFNDNKLTTKDLLEFSKEIQEKISDIIYNG